MANGRQYHMNTDSRQHWMDDALRRVAAERQAVDPVTAGGWDPSVMGWDNRDTIDPATRGTSPKDLMAAALAQPSVSKQRSPSGPSGFMGPMRHLLEGGQDITSYLKNSPIPEGPRITGGNVLVERALDPLGMNPSGTLGGAANSILDMFVGTLGDFGVTKDDPGHILDKDQAIPMGRLIATGLLPLKGIKAVARSLAGMGDETVKMFNKDFLGVTDDAGKVAARTRRMQEADDIISARHQARQATTDYPPLPDEVRKNKIAAEKARESAERAEILEIMGEAGLEDPNSVDAILREAYGSTPPKSSLDFLEPKWADDLASAEPVAQTSKGTPGLQRENILGPDGRPRIKMSESTGHLVPDRPLLKLDPATRGTSPAPRNPVSSRSGPLRSDSLRPVRQSHPGDKIKSYDISGKTFTTEHGSVYRVGDDGKWYRQKSEEAERIIGGKGGSQPPMDEYVMIPEDQIQDVHRYAQVTGTSPIKVHGDGRISIKARKLPNETRPKPGQTLSETGGRPTLGLYDPATAPDLEDYWVDGWEFFNPNSPNPVDMDISMAPFGINLVG